MLYVKKPMPVEAILLTDMKTALEWLQPGEYNVVTHDRICVMHNEVCYSAFCGVDYLVRDEKGVYPIPVEDFERDYVSLDGGVSTARFDFEAFPTDNGHIEVWCPTCGPISVVEDEERLGEAGMKHILESHKEQL